MVFNLFGLEIDRQSNYYAVWLCQVYNEDNCVSVLEVEFDYLKGVSVEFLGFTVLGGK